jgi:hypothetical protein
VGPLIAEALGFMAVGAAVQTIYLGCFLATAISCTFLIAPSVYHRLHWRRDVHDDVHDKEEMLRTCNRLPIVAKYCSPLP